MSASQRSPTTCGRCATLGLITADRRGVWVYYAVNPHGVAALINAFAGIVGTAAAMPIG